MVELNNLIGELDLFQREIDGGQQHMNNNDSTTTTVTTKSGTEQAQMLENKCIELNEKLLEKDNLDDSCSLTSYASINNNKNNNNDNNINSNDNNNTHSNTDLNRLVNDTDSLNMGAGYENPTFAHFAATAIPTHDATSYMCGNSDNGSGVVVIYDHQIPIPPDIDYVKQNSEIVLLRTKDPQQQNTFLPHETRELQQLSVNAYHVSDDDDDCGDDNGAQGRTNRSGNLATVKQRLSSFRASSDQQLQLLGLKQQHQHQQHNQIDKGMIKKTPITITTATITRITETGENLLKNDSDRNSLPIKKPIIISERPKAAPKPTMSGVMSNTISQKQQQQQNLQIYSAMKNQLNNKNNFKVDLDAKVRKQKEKLIKQQQQQQQRQQEHYQHIDTIPTTTISSKTWKNIPTADSLAVNSRYNHSMNLNVSHTQSHLHLHQHQYHNHIHQQEAQHQQQYHYHINQKLPELTNGVLQPQQPEQSEQQQLNGHYHAYHQNNYMNHNHYQNDINHTNIINTTTTTTHSLNTSSCIASNAKLNNILNKCVPVPAPVVPTPTIYVPQSAATISKPCILPRPASLMGAFIIFLCYVFWVHFLWWRKLKFI